MVAALGRQAAVVRSSVGQGWSSSSVGEDWSASAKTEASASALEQTSASAFELSFAESSSQARWLAA